MQDIVLSLASLVLLSISLGVVIGVLFTRGNYRRKLESLHREKDAEFRAEKAEISRELGTELARIRESIVQTVDAYEAAVQVLEDRLPNPDEQHLRLEVKVGAPLAVEYKGHADAIGGHGGRGGLRRMLQDAAAQEEVVAIPSEAAPEEPQAESSVRPEKDEVAADELEADSDAQPVSEFTGAADDSSLQSDNGVNGHGAHGDPHDETYGEASVEDDGVANGYETWEEQTKAPN